jgi:hypothetical protein
MQFVKRSHFHTLFDTLFDTHSCRHIHNVLASEDVLENETDFLYNK